jgi:hypothetical protein
MSLSSIALNSSRVYRMIWGDPRSAYLGLFVIRCMTSDVLCLVDSQDCVAPEENYWLPISASTPSLSDNVLFLTPFMFVAGCAWLFQADSTGTLTEVSSCWARKRCHSWDAL